MLFSQLIDDFEKAYMPRLAKPTQLKYTSLIRCHVRPALAQLEVTALNTRAVDQWLAGKSSLSWATRADLRNLISSIFRRAETWETYTGRNPAHRAYIGRKQPVYEKRKLSIVDTKRLLRELQPDARLICMVALFCGLRISEVLGLCWKHVDFDEGMLLIRQRYWRGDIDRTKSTASTRDVPFGSLTEIFRGLYPGSGHGNEYCFHVKRRNGVVLSRDDRAIRKFYLRPAAEKLGIYYKGFGFHAFRREAVTAIGREAGLMQASRVAGHSGVDVLNLYVLDEYDEQRAAIVRIQEPFLKCGLLSPQVRQ